MRIKFMLVAGAVAVATAIGGCAHSTPVTYAPVAYGETGYCYYVDSPAEAIALQAAGLCPTAWVPMLMPVYWHARYASYYDSPAYYGSYVPASYRTVYVTHVTTFERDHGPDIAANRNSARYKGSDGKSYTGAQTRGTYGGGTRTTGGSGSRSSNGGGTARSSTGGRSSGTSFGGGSRSTGGRR